MAVLLKKPKRIPGWSRFCSQWDRAKSRHPLYRKFGFEVFGTEPRALKMGSEYIDEQHMILMLRWSIGAHME